jgi:hypothetical protein
MYQRYYKQKKFGRIFSFCLVVGSGLGHYVKSGVGFLKDNFKIEKIRKYEEFMPEKLKIICQDYQNIIGGVIENKITREDKFDVMNKYWIYKNNLDNSRNSAKDEFINHKVNYPTKQDIKYKETYLLYKKYRFFF